MENKITKQDFYIAILMFIQIYLFSGNIFTLESNGSNILQSNTNYALLHVFAYGIFYFLLFMNFFTLYQALSTNEMEEKDRKVKKAFLLVIYICAFTILSQIIIQRMAY